MKFPRIIALFLALVLSATALAAEEYNPDKVEVNRVLAGTLLAVRVLSLLVIEEPPLFEPTANGRLVAEEDAVEFLDANVVLALP